MQTLPFEWYAEPAVLRAERESIFRRSWQYAGRAAQAAEPGQRFAARAGEIPVLVVRDGDGVLRAFLNVCRHRGSLLVESEGGGATIQCPYHAWTYDLDGSLRSAPRADREPGFDTDGLGLVPVAVDTWGPFVFVNPDAGAPPLAEHLGDLPHLLAEVVDVDALAFHSRAEAPVAANWKVVVENYLECYHCPVAHHGFSEVVDVSPDAYRLEESRWFSSQFGPVREPREGEVTRGQFHFLWPNTVVNVMPGPPNLSIGPVMPAGPETTERFLDYFFAPDADEGAVAELLAFDDQVGAEDRVLVERVQRGVRSAALPEGRLLPQSERLVAHFQRLVVDALAENPL